MTDSNPSVHRHVIPSALAPKSVYASIGNPRSSSAIYSQISGAEPVTSSVEKLVLILLILKRLPIFRGNVSKCFGEAVPITPHSFRKNKVALDNAGKAQASLNLFTSWITIALAGHVLASVSLSLWLSWVI